MTTVLCTLYNSLYLDKGLVLYDSLCECAKDFKLYVLCMDDKCYEVLTDLHQEHHIPIRLSDFEEGDEELLIAKSNRPIGEYCWTCSSSFIRYVLNNLQEPICTYIDADMYFYHDPQALVDEMIEAGKSVMVTPHRFSKERAALASIVGNYCVEFNTFVNNKSGLEVLEYWRARCIDSCSQRNDGVHYGDQKYLDEIVEIYDCVHICQNEGAGLAQWNISSYFFNINEKIVFKPLNKLVNIVFFHYQNVSYITPSIIKIGPNKNDNIDDKFVSFFYIPYLRLIKNKKEYLYHSYSINTLILEHPAKKHRFKYLKNTIIGKVILYIQLMREKKIVVKI